jgi:hypothetical protein
MVTPTATQNALEEIRSYLVNARKKSSALAHHLRRQADAVDESNWDLALELRGKALQLDDIAKDADAIIYGGLL